MLDHIGFTVSDIKRSKAFYDAAFAAVGAKVIMKVEVPEYTGYGYGRDKPDFWIAADNLPMRSLHVAISCDSRDQVDAFYAAALAAGGRDNGPPGLRRQYHPHYYAAFVYDPDGNNFEAVCHAPA